MTLKDIIIAGKLTISEGGGGGVFPPFTKMAEGDITFPERYSTTGNREIVKMDDIGFTPRCFVFYLSDNGMNTISEYYRDGTETAGVLYFTIYLETPTGDEITPKLYNRQTWRAAPPSSEGAAITNSGAGDNKEWVNQSNNYLYSDGNSIYFRTASGYALEKDLLYHWIALA